MSDTTKAVTTPVRASQSHEKENMVYQFTINRLPSKYLSKNSGRRWLPQMIDAKFKEDIKTTIAFFLEKYTRPSEPLQQATVTVKLYFRYRRHRDHTSGCYRAPRYPVHSRQGEGVLNGVYYCPSLD